MPFSIGSGGSGISLVAFGGLVDEIGQFRNLLRRREDQIDRLVDVVFDRIERHHAGLSDPGPHPAGRHGSGRRSAASRRTRRCAERTSRKPAISAIASRVAASASISRCKPGVRYLQHGDRDAPGIGFVCHAGVLLMAARSA